MKRMSLIVFVALVMAVASPAAQQTPPRDPAATGRPPAASANPTTPDPTAILSGVVVNSAGRPVRRARVMLTAPELPGGKSVTTDREGGFLFAKLPAGRYTIGASKMGYVASTYGQKRPGNGAAGTPIQLIDGQQLKMAVVMPQGGALTGIVLDELGDPSAGTQMRAYRQIFRDGQRAFSSVGSATTDDRGVYRIYGLVPGDYIVNATPRNNAREEEMMAMEMQMRVEMVKAQAGAAMDAVKEAAMARDMRTASLAPPDGPTEGYTPIYFPGTPASAAATTVTLGVGEERGGVDFQLQLVPFGRIDGVVLTSGGVTPQNVQLQMVNTSEQVPGLGIISARARPDGKFTITGVPSGQYTLIARASMPRGPEWTPAQAARAETITMTGGGMVIEKVVGPANESLFASVDVAVDGRGLEGVTLALQPGITISGRLVFDGAAPRPPDFTRIRVSAGQVLPGMLEMPPPTSKVEADGRFTLSGVLPGRYRNITASVPGPGQWRVSSALVGGREIMDFPLDVKTEAFDAATITLSDRSTEYSGTLQDVQGRATSDYSVIVFAADRQYWTPQSRRIQATRPGTDGKFSIRNLPPGDYLVVAVDDVEPGQWMDPKFLEPLAGLGMRITLADGEKKTQDVRVGR